MQIGQEVLELGSEKQTDRQTNRDFNFIYIELNTGIPKLENQEKILNEFLIFRKLRSTFCRT